MLKCYHWLTRITSTNHLGIQCKWPTFSTILTMSLLMLEQPKWWSIRANMDICNVRGYSRVNKHEERKVRVVWQQRAGTLCKLEETKPTVVAELYSVFKRTEKTVIYCDQSILFRVNMFKETLYNSLLFLLLSKGINKSLYDCTECSTCVFLVRSED